MLSVKEKFDSFEEPQKSFEDKKQDLLLLELELRLLELEASKLQACSASTTSYLSASRPAKSSVRGSLTSLISANDPTSRPPSPSINSGTQPLLKQSRPPSNFNSPRASLVEFDHRPSNANFLRRDFVRDLAKSATVEIQREREAFHLGNNSKNLTTRGKIMALNTEAESLKSVTLEAKKLAEKIQGQQFKINQFYRWIHRNWVEKTERELRWLRLKINSEERYQQRKFFSERSCADIELLETNNMKTEQQLNSTLVSLQNLHYKNGIAASKNNLVIGSTEKVIVDIDELQRKLLTQRRKIHEKDAMKFSLEMRNQSLVKHVLDIDEVNQINAKKFGLQSIPKIDFVSDWIKSKNYELGLRKELEICCRRRSMLAFQVQKAKIGVQKDQRKILAGPQCSPADTLRQSTKSDFETTSNISTNSNTPSFNQL